MFHLLSESYSSWNNSSKPVNHFVSMICKQRLSNNKFKIAIVAPNNVKIIYNVFIETFQQIKPYIRADKTLYPTQGLSSFSQPRIPLLALASFGHQIVLDLHPLSVNNFPLLFHTNINVCKSQEIAVVASDARLRLIL